MIDIEEGNQEGGGADVRRVIYPSSGEGSSLRCRYLEIVFLTITPEIIENLSLVFGSCTPAHTCLLLLSGKGVCVRAHSPGSLVHHHQPEALQTFVNHRQR